MIKVKISSSWCNEQESLKRVLLQFKTSAEDIQGIKFVYDDSYEVLVVLGYIKENIKPGARVLVFPHEPTWSGGHQKTFNLDNNIKLFGFNTYIYSGITNVIETIAHMVYGGRGPWQEGYDNWTYDNIISNQFLKSKIISSFVSSRNSAENTDPICTYKSRVDLINYLIPKCPFIDFYGGYISTNSPSNVKEFSQKKYDDIKDYKFCLTIENSNENYYVSEKFYDCMLTNTVPIYFGCKNIKQLWPEEGYIVLDNITDHLYVENVLQNIYNNADTIYEKMMPFILQMKDKYFREFNLLKKIKKEIFNER